MSSNKEKNNQEDGNKKTSSKNDIQIGAGLVGLLTSEGVMVTKIARAQEVLTPDSTFQIEPGAIPTGQKPALKKDEKAYQKNYDAYLDSLSVATYNRSFNELDEEESSSIVLKAARSGFGTEGFIPPDQGGDGAGTLNRKIVRSNSLHAITVENGGTESSLEDFTVMDAILPVLVMAGAVLLVKRLLSEYAIPVIIVTLISSLLMSIYIQASFGGTVDEVMMYILTIVFASTLLLSPKMRSLTQRQQLLHVAKSILCPAAISAIGHFALSSDDEIVTAGTIFLGLVAVGLFGYFGIFNGYFKRTK